MTLTDKQRDVLTIAERYGVVYYGSRRARAAADTTQAGLTRSLNALRKAGLLRMTADGGCVLTDRGRDMIG